MKRILHLISQLEEGGAQRVLSNVLKHSKAYEAEVAALIASPPERRLAFFRQADVPIHSLSYSNDFYAPEILPALEQLLSGRRFDLVHCWMYQSIIQGGIACRKLDIPCVAAVHSMKDMLILGNHKEWERRMIDRTLRFSDIQLFPSTSSAVDFLDTGCLNADCVRIVRNGVDCDYFQPANGGTHLVSVGRVSAEKGYDDLRKVVEALQKTEAGMRCLIAGDGAAAADDTLEFAGHVEDIRAFLQNAAVYISTSQTEGMSMALLEAQACGIPAVVRNLGGNSEVIEQGVTGFLCRTVDDFADSVARLWNHPELRLEMSRNARKRIVESFSVRQQAGSLESIYSELL